MRLFILSKNKPTDAPVYKWLGSYSNHTTIISPEDDITAYKKSYSGTIVKAPKGCNSLIKKRAYAISTLKKNEWALLLTDNIVRVTGVKNPKDLTRVGFSNPYTVQELIKAIEEDIRLAGTAVLGGIASNDNHYFRQRKYRTVGFVRGNLMYVKNCGLDIDTTITFKDDYTLTANALQHSGKVLLNNWLFAHTKRFEGKLDRAEGDIQAAKYLVDKYRGLYRVKNRKGMPDGTEVQMTFTNEKQVAVWRMKNRPKNKYITT